MNRREFLEALLAGATVTAAGLYVPKRFYSFAPPPTAWELSDLIVTDILNVCELRDRRVCITGGGLERAGVPFDLPS